MKLKMTSILLLLCMLIASSCGKKDSGSSSSHEKNESTSSNKNPHIHRSELAVSSFSFERLGNQNILTTDFDVRHFIRGMNIFDIKAELSNASSDAKLVCYRLIFDNRFNKMEAAFDSNQSAIIRTEIRDSDPNVVEHECIVYDGEEIIFEKNFKIYKSFAVQGLKELSILGLSQNDKIGFLLFTEDSTLYVKDKEVNLEVDEIISLGGLLTTYTEYDALNNYNDAIGLPGGNINIKTKRATGELNIVMRGMNGGKRSTFPKDKTEKLPRDPSLDGRCRDRHERPDRRRTECFGKKGHRGVKGENGYSGFPGGDSGKLNLVIEEETDAKINIEIIPGIGSLGTKGGKGGFGSPGGIGKTVTWTTYGGCGREGPCNANDHYYTYPNGAEGDRGPDGDPGEKGADGNALNAEITIAGEKTFIEKSWNN